VAREVVISLSDESALKLAEPFLGKEIGPGEALIREEVRARVRAALTELATGDREVLVMRHLEQMSVRVAPPYA
jgi:DNA-directed RNA polymerase specialized sigma24 family protein